MTMDTATQGVRAVTIGPGYVPYASQANFTVSSDPRVKDIIGNYKTGLNAIKEMNPIAFRYNGLGDTVRSDDLSYGFDGAEMSRIMPETTRQRPDGYLMLDQGPVLLALVNAVKELAIKVEKLESGK
jgi:hypothetical protein